MQVPCGKCVQCLSRRRQEWSVRLLHELRVSSSAHFITLTYDEKNMPYGILPTLVKRDFQLFMKRLRDRTENKVRYYAVGEYGEKSGRPHYHAIIFNLAVDEIDTFEMVDGAWHFGMIYIGAVTPASIGYVTKYLINNFEDKGAREKPFSIMSRRPGIGDQYVERYRSYHEKDVNRNYIVLPGGNKTRMPRYYRDRLYNEDQRQIQSAVALNKMARENQKKREKWKRKEKSYYEYEREKKVAFEKKVKDKSKEKL